MFYFQYLNTNIFVGSPGPEIDPFWYVGRGVRPIGRFGKRHSVEVQLGSREMQPVVRMLELLINSIKNKENLGKVLDGEDQDWLPWQLVLFLQLTTELLVYLFLLVYLLWHPVLFLLPEMDLYIKYIYID